jgi:ABC-type phosphate/phosphonate transport system substrate-binding protein
MDQDPAGQVILAHLGIDRFQPIEDQAYTAVRQLVQQSEQKP